MLSKLEIKCLQMPAGLLDSLFRFVCGQFLLLRDSMVLRDSAPADRAAIATSKKDKGEIEKKKRRRKS